MVGRSTNFTGTNAQYGLLQISGNSAGATGDGRIVIGRGEVPSAGNQSLGQINFVDNTAGEYASIKAFTDGSCGTDDYPGRIEFHTTADAASSPVERLTITSDGKVRLPDDGNLAFGDDDDMLMRHSGNDAVIENTVGHIFISNYTNDEDIYLRTDDGSGGIANYVECDGSSGKVKLSHYGTKKFETTSTGVEVTGTLNATTAVTQNGNALATNGKAIAMALIFG